MHESLEEPLVAAFSEFDIGLSLFAQPEVHGHRRQTAAPSIDQQGSQLGLRYAGTVANYGA